MHITPELLKRYDRPGPRYTSYPTALEFQDSFTNHNYIQRLKKASDVDAPLSLYIHLPFCRKRCLYCACNVVISPHGKASMSYLEALHREIKLVAQHVGSARPVTQLHFGGGTPTYYEPGEIVALMDVIRANFALAEDAEIAMELDPRVTTPEHLEALASQGFNRLSLGVQDIDSRVQETIGRIQPVAQTQQLIDQARALGIDDINIDLIYGLPHQNIDTFTRTLRQTITWAPQRLAIYGFAWVPWVQKHQRKLPEEAMPSPQERLDLLSLASSMLTEAGYEHIGMDHFARPDSSLCRARREGKLWRNFMGYTTSRAPDMLGLGLSSIGEVSDAYVQNHKKLSLYLKDLSEGRLPIARGLAKTDDDLLRGHIIRELMSNLTLEISNVERLYEINFEHCFKPQLQALAEMEKQGLVRLTPSHIHVTSLGQIFVRNIAMLFDSYLPKHKRDKPVFSRTV